jgi:hypothetical protein
MRFPPTCMAIPPPQPKRRTRTRMTSRRLDIGVHRMQDRPSRSPTSASWLGRDDGGVARRRAAPRQRVQPARRHLVTVRPFSKPSWIACAARSTQNTVRRRSARTQPSSARRWAGSSHSLPPGRGRTCSERRSAYRARSGGPTAGPCAPPKRSRRSCVRSATWTRARRSFSGRP